MAERQLNLFVNYSYTPAFYALPATERRSLRESIVKVASPLAQATHLYSVFPARSDTDILIWSAWEVEEAGQELAGFFKSYHEALEALRTYIAPTQSLWGFTRVSTYARGKSEQDIDPFGAEARAPYLVVYPFSKTKEWYLMSMDARQGQMNEHIKLGKQYPEIKQLLLYSFGLQDQEFVVSYEMDSLPKFSELVNALRATEARRHTLLDTPLVTGIYCTPEEFTR